MLQRSVSRATNAITRRASAAAAARSPSTLGTGGYIGSQLTYGIGCALAAIRQTERCPHVVWSRRAGLLGLLAPGRRRGGQTGWVHVINRRSAVPASRRSTT